MILQEAVEKAIDETDHEWLDAIAESWQKLTGEPWETKDGETRQEGLKANIAALFQIIEEGPVKLYQVRRSARAELYRADLLEKQVIAREREIQTLKNQVETLRGSRAAAVEHGDRIRAECNSQRREILDLRRGFERAELKAKVLTESIVSQLKMRRMECSQMERDTRGSEGNLSYGWACQVTAITAALRIVELTRDGDTDQKSVCSVCKWTNTNLLNLGEPGNPNWVCQGCCKRALESRRLDRHP